MYSARLAWTCFVALIATSVLTANAERSVSWGTRRASRPIFQQTESRDEKAVSESLRSDVAQHPDEFVVFETRAAAERFMRDHMPDSSRETEPEMVAGHIGILAWKDAGGCFSAAEWAHSLIVRRSRHRSAKSEECFAGDAP
jgi:hypothetical protein